MALNERAMQRLRAVNLCGDEIAHMFEVVAENAELVGSMHSEATLNYKTDGTARVGEYIPRLALVVTKVTKENMDQWNEEPPVVEDSKDSKDSA